MLKAFVPVLTARGWTIASVEEDEPGLHQVSLLGTVYFPSWDYANKHASIKNMMLGLSQEKITHLVITAYQAQIAIEGRN